jgi:molybdenum cofactor cytidylyltransferase
VTGTDDLPRYDAEEIAEALEGTDSADATAPTVVGVLLAGGTSSRFGDRNKLLAEVDGEPLGRRAAGTLLEADLGEVIAVLGHESEAVRAALADLDVRFVENPAYEEGLSTSVSRGAAAVGSTDADAAVFLPGDMPAVDPATVGLLVDAYRAGIGSALAAAYDGRRGNPVLFDRAHFEALAGVEGDVGGRPVLLESDGGALVETTDPGVVEDVDTTDDLRRHR